MTEEEAKTKWCPMAINKTVSYQENNTEFVGVYLDEEGKLTVNCIASSCMMWVWDKVPESTEQMKAAGIVGIRGVVDSTTSGYCGLRKG